MSHYAEAHAEKHHKPNKRNLDHIRIHANENADGHIVAHHYDDGSVEHYEFAHPHENADALAHLAEHMGIGEEESEG
jgi:hypothetical protein